MKITITGTAGSGKSSVAKMLAEKLGYRHFSVGDFQRELAKEHHMTILEWGEHEAKDRKYDIMVDEKQAGFGRDNDDFVLDSWLAARFVPDAYKIFLDADIDARVKRRLSQKREEESFSGFEETKKSIISRQEVNHERWMRYYGFDYNDMKNYDMAVDTTKLSIKEIVDMIIKALKEKEKSSG